MNIKTIIFSLLLITNCANAIKQIKPNLIKKLVDEIKRVDKSELAQKSSYNPAPTNYAYRKIIANQQKKL